MRMDNGEELNSLYHTLNLEYKRLAGYVATMEECRCAFEI
jgi:hypothetical protein